MKRYITTISSACLVILIIILFTSCSLPNCTFFSSTQDLKNSQLYDSDVDQYYTSIEEPASILRKHLKERRPRVDIGFRTTKENTKETPKEIFTKAIEHTGVSNEGDYLKNTFVQYTISTKGYKKAGTYFYTFTYTIEYMTNNAQEKMVDVEIERLLGNLNLHNLSDYEKATTIYDYLCNNVSYDYENKDNNLNKLKHSAYAALINKTSVCQGYANLFYLLALESGLDARIISGVSKGENHAWNIVNIDGLYYNLDATWDSSYAQANLDYQYFLKSDENFPDHEPSEEFTDISFLSEHPKSSTDYCTN